MTAFRVMARLKSLRGTWLDPFCLSEERKLKRRLLAEFEADVEEATVVALPPRPTRSPFASSALMRPSCWYWGVKEASAADAARARANALHQLKAAKKRRKPRRRRGRG